MKSTVRGLCQDHCHPRQGSNINKQLILKTLKAFICLRGLKNWNLCMPPWKIYPGLCLRLRLRFRLKIIQIKPSCLCHIPWGEFFMSKVKNCVFSSYFQNGKMWKFALTQKLLKSWFPEIFSESIFIFSTLCSQCGNYRIFLPYRFYVKSIFETLEVQNLSF